MTKRARLLARMHDVLAEEPPLRVLNVAEYGCASLPRAVGTLRTATLEPVDPILPRIGVPVLIIRAEHDRLSSAGWVEHLAGLGPDIQVVQLPGAGHDVFHRAADAVAEVAAPFLVWRPGSEVAAGQ